MLWACCEQCLPRFPPFRLPERLLVNRINKRLLMLDEYWKTRFWIAKDLQISHGSHESEPWKWLTSSHGAQWERLIIRSTSAKNIVWVVGEFLVFSTTNEITANFPKIHFSKKVRGSARGQSAKRVKAEIRHWKSHWNSQRLQCRSYIRTGSSSSVPNSLIWIGSFSSSKSRSPRSGSWTLESRSFEHLRIHFENFASVNFIVKLREAV